MSRTGRIYRYGETVMHYQDIAERGDGVVFTLQNVCGAYFVLKTDDSDTLEGGCFRHYSFFLYSIVCSIYKINQSKLIH